MTGTFKCARLSDDKKAAIVSVLVLAALMIGLVLSVAACGGGGGLEGTWVSAKDGETVVITGDKLSVDSPSAGKYEFTYKVDGDKLLLTLEGVLTDQPATYKLDGDTLTISAEGEDAVTYTRK